MATATRYGWPALALLAVLLIVPAALAEYQGPGHDGMVPLGDGGLLAGLAPELGAGTTHIAITGIPKNACALDIKGLEDGPRVGLAWRAGNETAYVYAEVGARDAWFQITGHWVWDVKAECTIEHTESGVVYHDPRGRPFIDIRFLDHRPVFQPTTGTWTLIEVPLRNNGTIEERVDLVLEQQREAWRIRNASATAGVRIGAEATYPFSFELFVPASEPARMNLMVLRASGQESGIEDRALLVFDLKQGSAPVAEAAPPPPPELPPYEPPEEAPAPPVVLVLAALAAILVARRRTQRGARSVTFRRSVLR